MKCKFVGHGVLKNNKNWESAKINDFAVLTIKESDDNPIPAQTSPRGTSDVDISNSVLVLLSCHVTRYVQPELCWQSWKHPLVTPQAASLVRVPTG